MNSLQNPVIGHRYENVGCDWFIVTINVKYDRMLYTDMWTECSRFAVTNHHILMLTYRRDKRSP